MIIKMLKLIWNKVSPDNAKFRYRMMEVDDVEFIINSLRSEAKEGHFTSALLDVVECNKYYATLMNRARGQVLIDNSNRIKIPSLIKFIFVFENEKNEKIGFIELSEKQPGDFCKDSFMFENVEILALFVSKDYRGKGYAEKFISTTLSELPAKRTISARCAKSSVKMTTILERLGFSCINVNTNGSKWMKFKVKN